MCPIFKFKLCSYHDSATNWMDLYNQILHLLDGQETYLNLNIYTYNDMKYKTPFYQITFAEYIYIMEQYRKSRHLKLYESLIIFQNIIKIMQPTTVYSQIGDFKKASQIGETFRIKILIEVSQSINIIGLILGVSVYPGT